MRDTGDAAQSVRHSDLRHFREEGLIERVELVGAIQAESREGGAEDGPAYLTYVSSVHSEARSRFTQVVKYEYLIDVQRSPDNVGPATEWVSLTECL